MRLLIASGIFHPDIGGPATYLRALAETLTDAGHDVCVVTYGDVAVSESYPFAVRRVSRSGHALLRLTRFIRALSQMSRGYPVWFVNDYGVPALVVSKWRRPSVVMKIVGDFAWEYSRRHGLVTDGIDEFQRRSYGWRVTALKRLQSRYVRSANRVIVPSQYLAGLVIGWGVPADRVRVIYNAVSIGEMGRRAVRRPAGPLLLTAGRLTSWKGMDHALEILALLRPRLPSVRLAIAGDGPMAETLHEQADRLGLNDAVLWLGTLAREDLIAWMRQADTFVLLSEYEGFPHVAIEAMAVGLPVALSRAGGNPELVADGDTGLLLEARDHVGSAEALAALLTDEPRRRALAERSRARAAEFQWSALLSRTLAVLDEAVAERRGHDA